MTIIRNPKIRCDAVFIFFSYVKPAVYKFSTWL